MVTLLITSALLLGFLVVVLYFWQKSNTDTESGLLRPPPEPRGLFNPEQSSELKALAAANVKAEDERQRTAIIESASHGDRNALQQAHSLGDLGLYNSALESLINLASTNAQLLALVSYVMRAQLPVNIRLAQLILESWKESPDRSSTAKTLHIVALANDAALYNAAVENAIQFWREGRLSDISTQELRALLEGEFWLLSSNVRGSGAGFLLKRTLANARRELEAQAPVNQ